MKLLAIALVSTFAFSAFADVAGLNLLTRRDPLVQGIVRGVQSKHNVTCRPATVDSIEGSAFRASVICLDRTQQSGVRIDINADDYGHNYIQINDVRFTISG